MHATLRSLISSKQKTLHPIKKLHWENDFEFKSDYKKCARERFSLWDSSGNNRAYCIPVFFLNINLIARRILDTHFIIFICAIANQKKSTRTYKCAHINMGMQKWSCAKENDLHSCRVESDFPACIPCFLCLFFFCLVRIYRLNRILPRRLPQLSSLFKQFGFHFVGSRVIFISSIRSSLKFNGVHRKWRRIFQISHVNTKIEQCQMKIVQPWCRVQSARGIEKKHTHSVFLI